MARRSHARQGFTLVELLVALSVMALLAVLSWRGIDSMTRTQARTQERADEVLTLQAGLNQWSADLDAMLQLPQVPAPSCAPPSKTTGRSNPKSPPRA